MSVHHPGESLSPWSAEVSMPTFNILTRDTDADVCVIGGGVAGITTAYLLQKEGRRVVLLECFELASGQTAKTTAHLSNALDDRYFELEKYHGQKGAKLAAESHTAAIEKLAQIVRDEKIDCDFEYLDGFLFQGDESENETLQSEFEAVQRIGLDVSATSSVPIENFPQGPALRFAKQAQVHPLKYLKRLVEIFTANGGEIFTHTFADEVQGGLNAFVKMRQGYKVKCKDILVATNSPINDIFAIHTKQAAYRTYALAFEIPPGHMQKALYWDTMEPYHYLRLESDTVLIVGGEDHKTGQDSHPEHHYAALESWTREKIPFVGKVLHQWSGQVMEPTDGLAFLGHNPSDQPNVYVITGDSGNGMTHATIGAMLITDQILQRPNPWEQLYNPSRLSVRAIANFIKENSNVAAQYVDWITPRAAATMDDIASGHGDVFWMGSQVVAGYKDDDGHEYLMSAACPHLGGVVSWNSSEKSWDCPCHGSRFDCYGKVIEGPAKADLTKIKSAAVMGRPIPVVDLQAEV